MFSRNLIVCLLSISFLGCQSKKETTVKLYPVEGKLFIDGVPAAGASIKFVLNTNLENTRAQRSSGATVGEDGTFKVSTFDQEDGMPPGRYSGLVFWLTTPEGGGMMVDRLQGRFMDPAKPAISFEILQAAKDLGEIRLQTKD